MYLFYALACLCLALTLGASMASASKGVIGTFGSTGENPGQFEAPRGVAVNESTGEVYVVDKHLNRIEVFDANGDQLSQFGGNYLSLSPKGFLPLLKEPEGIAIDQASGDVYVTNNASHSVDVFSAAGVFAGAFGSEGPNAGQFGAKIGYLAVNPDNGNVVVADSSNERIDEFSVTVTLGVVTNSAFVRAIGWGVVSNADDELQICTTATGCVAGLAGAGVGEFGASGPTRVTVDSSGSMYAVDPSNSRVQKFTFEPSLGASEYAPTQLSGSSTPSDVMVEPGTDHIYVTKLAPNAVTSELEQQVFEFDAAGTPIGTSDGLGAHISSDDGLALSSFNGDIYLSSEFPENHVFILNSIAPQSVGATDVASTSATLQAQINPGGSETTYRFEYGMNVPYEASVPAPDGNAGSGTVIVPVSVHLQNLASDRTYHFRVLATNSLNETTYSSDRTFTTQIASSGLVLPDARMWEMVSPPDKEGAVLEPIDPYREGGAVIQASEDGGAITYVANAPIETHPAGSRSPEDVQVLSTRGSVGWKSQDIATPHDSATNSTEIGHLSEYKLFSGDLSLGIVEPAGETPLSPDATEKTIYLRRPNGEYEPLVTAANVPAGTKFGQSVSGEEVNFESATPDLSHVVLSSPEALTPGAVKDGSQQSLYEWAGGQLRLASVLPGGKPATEEGESAELGKADVNLRHAISNDGSRIIWEAANGLYLRDMITDETVEVSANQEGLGSNEEIPVFQTANSSGSRVFFTDNEPLTPNSTAGYSNPELYVFEVTSGSGEKLAGSLTDLTPGKYAGEDVDLQGAVIGASEDGSYVYFVANGVLTSVENGEHEKAMAGADNLYVEHYNGAEWASPTFIATLSPEDGPDFARGSLAGMTSRVSPNGHYLAFMSERSLTGYDNRDATSGEADEEIFLYNVDSNHVVCVSCNPTGARPEGVHDPTGEELIKGLSKLMLVDEGKLWLGRWLAGNIPGWTSVDLAHALYQSRYLSDSGRLFFDSSDALVSTDVNGKEDVYEYEPDEIGGCQESGQSAGNVFSHQAGGCLGLISSGASSEESAFLDASETGNNVFFLTDAQLVALDYDKSFDVYDAHECTSESPCPPPSVAVPQPCTTTDSCRVAPSPQPEIFGAPPSATFSGVSNLAPSVLKSPSEKAKPLTRVEKLAKALKTCKKLKGKKRRTTCEARARKKYRSKKASKKSDKISKKGRK